METESIEEKYRALLKLVKDSGIVIVSSRMADDKKGPAWIAREITAFTFNNKNPRDRVVVSPKRDINIFQSIGQFLWIVQGSFQLESIAYYADSAKRFSTDNITMTGAYGFRLFGPGHLNQMAAISDELDENPTTRRAVASIFMTQFDRHRQKDEVPCTLNLQFMVRNEKLDMITYMRSQDVHKLLPHDLFIFTMIQEYQAALLQRDIGTYNHLSGSFHIYENELASIDAIINETTPSQGPMIAMPQDQANIHMLNTIKFENELRTDVLRSLSTPTIKIDFDYFHDGIDKMPEYWKQLSLMLVAYGCTKLKDIDQLKRISSKVKQPLKTFVDRELALLESGRGKLA